MTDFEAFAGLRTPLPEWWPEPRRDVDFPLSVGVAFEVRRRDGRNQRFVVRRAVFEVLLGGLADLAACELAWARVQDRFYSAGCKRLPNAPGETVYLGLADIGGLDDLGEET